MRSIFPFFLLSLSTLGVVAVGCGADDATSTPLPDAGNDATTSRPDSATDPPSEDGGDGGRDSGPVVGVPSGPVCATWAAKTCAFLEKCQPKLMEVELADPKTCVAHLESICNAGVPAGTDFRKDDADALTTCVNGLTCDDTYGPRWLYACSLPRLVNAKPLGGGCRRDEECESRGCSGSSIQCGKCVPVVEAGGACDATKVCARSGVCSTGRCIVPAFLGEACDANRVCGNGLTCTGGKCAKNGGVVGTACTQNSACDLAQLVACNDATQKCEAFTFIDPGGTCERFGDAPQACSKGSHCDAPQAGTPGTCVAGKKVGEACTSSNDCEGLINCREGKCVLPAYVACP